MDRLTGEVKEFARSIGADMVGIAGKECFGRMPNVQPDELLPEAESVVVIGCRRMNARTGQYRPSWDGQEHWVGRFATLMQTVQRTSDFLEDKGYECVPVSWHGTFEGAGVPAAKAIKHLSIGPEGEMVGREQFEKTYWQSIKALSHMHLAVEAGLGEIGWCRQVVTLRFGPRVAFGSIVTDAPLEPDKKLVEPVCMKEECGKCVEYCRSGALSPGVPSEWGTDVSKGYNVAKCIMQMGGLPPVEVINRKDKKELGRFFAAQSGRGLVVVNFPVLDTITSHTTGGGGCGMCLVVCPVGQRRPVKPLVTKGKPSVGTVLL